MKCPKCEEMMRTDTKDEVYICKCGNEIKWSLTKDNENPKV